MTEGNANRLKKAAEMLSALSESRSDAMIVSVGILSCEEILRTVLTDLIIRPEVNALTYCQKCHREIHPHRRCVC